VVFVLFVGDYFPQRAQRPQRKYRNISGNYLPVGCPRRILTFLRKENLEIYEKFVNFTKSS